MFILLLLFATTINAVITKNSIDLYAITNEGNGVKAELTIEIKPGTGQIYTSINPLIGKTTQSTQRTAVKIAENYFPFSNNFDYFFTIDSAATEVDGPSAGGAMTLLLITMLQDKELPENIAMTGTINEVGQIGAVDGIYSKLQAASEQGIKLFMIPEGEAQQYARDIGEYVNLLSYGPKELNVKVIEINTIDEAMEYVFMDIDSIPVEIVQEVTQFVPKEIQLRKGTELMIEVTDSILADTIQHIREAEVMLESSSLSNGEITLLYGILTDARKVLSESKIMRDQNYLYSAATNAFLAKNYALIVKDLSSNPELFESDAEIILEEIQKIKQRNAEITEKLDKWMPIDYVEWHTSAQMRSSYSYVVINDLENTINENGMDEFLSSMISYEATKSWLDTSEKILSITEKSEKKVIRDSQFNSKAIETILEVEEKIESLEYGLEKIQAEQKLNAAKRELNQKWYETSYLNASIALGFIKAYEISTDQNYETLLEILTTEIQKIDETIAQEEWVDGWSILYVDHAKFLLEKAQFQDNNLMATMDLQEGIAYLMVSKELMKSTIEVKEYYANFEEKDFIKDLQAQITIGEIESNPMSNLLIAIFFYSILILIIFLVFAWIVAKNKNSVTIKKELKELDSLEKNLNKEKIRGIITHEEYERKLLVIKNQKKELISHLKSNNLEREIITKIKLKNRSINKLLIELKPITENKNLETVSINPNENKKKLLTKMNYENILLTTQNELNETIKNIKLELNSINIENKLKENKKNENKKSENKSQINKSQMDKLQNTKLQNTKLQNTKLQNTKLQNTKLQNNKIRTNKLSNSSKIKKQKTTKAKTKSKI